MSKILDQDILKKKRFVNIFHNPITAWIILGTSLGLTFFAYRISSDFVHKRAEDRFIFRLHEIKQAIKDRLDVYEQVLWSGVGLMYASENLKREGFSKFVEALNIQRHWPGIQGVGFSVFLKPEEKQAHIDAIRAQGFPNFQIKPEGEREMYSSIVYLEPFDWRNKRAFGYDMWSNDMRQEAMKRARDEAVAATSGIITLVQETNDDVQKGFLTYVPVYKSKSIPRTLEERRNQFLGWVYAPYRTGNLMKGILGAEDPNIEFEIFDGENMNQESLLFDSNDELHISLSNDKPDFEKVIKVVNQGRTWTLYFSTPYNYLSNSEKNQPRFVAIAGLIVDVLLFYVIYSLYFINRRAEAMARELTKDAKEDKESLMQALKEAEGKADELKKTNEVMVNREAKMVELKKEIIELKKRVK